MTVGMTSSAQVRDSSETYPFSSICLLCVLEWSGIVPTSSILGAKVSEKQESLICNRSIFTAILVFKKPYNDVLVF